MPKIQTYEAKDEKLTPSAEGTAAWETAGRRLGPLYNEAGHLLWQGMEEQIKAGDRQVKAAAEVEQATSRSSSLQDQLNKAWDSQIKDLYAMGEAKAASGSHGGAAGAGGHGGAGGGMSWHFGGGGEEGAHERGGRGLQNYGAATEINTGAGIAHKGIDTMSLGEYRQEQDDLYNNIAGGARATPAQLNWFMNKRASDQAITDKANAAMVAENGEKAANDWYYAQGKAGGPPLSEVQKDVARDPTAFRQLTNELTSNAPSPAPSNFGQGWFGTQTGAGGGGQPDPTDYSGGGF